MARTRKNSAANTAKNGENGDAIVIKKYANRRLYNTATSSYVTLDHLCQMVKDGTDFVVFDAKSGEDITHSVLTQIIFEEEGKGQNMLPSNFLRQLIRFYGDNLQALVPNYLEMSMDSFSKNQEQMRSYMNEAFGFPFNQFEEMGRQNITMMQNAMRMFNPFTAQGGQGIPGMPGTQQGEGEGEAKEGAEGDSAKSGEDLEVLKSQLAAMQDQLNKLSSDK